MKSDFKMIVHKLDKDLPYINLYPIADLHIGSQEFNETMFKQWLKVVTEDSFSYIVMAGDLMNMGLKSSKSNCYEEVMRPSEQKEYLTEALRPIKSKILAACGGNHCYRPIKEADDDPLYDVFARLQIEDTYRQNACFVKVNVGSTYKNKNKQVSYGIVVTHGATRNKYKNFVNGIDGCDLFISGHTHENEYAQPSKIRLDMQNEGVTTVPYRRIVCTPFQSYGGYALRGHYTPSGIDEFQAVRLDGVRKKLNFFTV